MAFILSLVAYRVGLADLLSIPRRTRTGYLARIAVLLIAGVISYAGVRFYIVRNLEAFHRQHPEWLAKASSGHASDFLDRTIEEIIQSVQPQPAGQPPDH